MTDNDLRWRLRQLPREMDPPADLWPGIAARLRAPVPRRRRHWPVLLAIAACLCLAVGLAVTLRPAPAAGFESQLVQREAEAMTREYEAALRELGQAPAPEAIAPSLVTLDDSAREIRAALEADPDSVRLLDQLRRTYTRRLALTQRAAMG